MPKPKPLLFLVVSPNMVSDHLKTVVDAIFVGKERQFNRRFLTLANHYLFEPVACTPGSGWEKGQVENQVGNSREWLFTPLVKLDDFATLNGWLATRCREFAGRIHPEQTSRTIAECFAKEQLLLMPVNACFDGYVKKQNGFHHGVSSALTAIVTVFRRIGQIPSFQCASPPVRCGWLLMGK